MPDDSPFSRFQSDPPGQRVVPPKPINPQPTGSQSTDLSTNPKPAATPPPATPTQPAPWSTFSPPQEHPPLEDIQFEELLPEENEDDEETRMLKSLMLKIFIGLGIFILLVVGVWLLFFKNNTDAEPHEPNQPSEPLEPSEPAEPSEPGEPTEPTEPDLISGVLINASQGGTIIATNGGGELIIPPHALLQDTKIIFERVETSAVVDQYKIEPDGVRFVTPATLRIPYKEQFLSPGETPQSIILEHVTPSGKNRLSFTVDTVTKRLEVKLTRF